MRAAHVIGRHAMPADREAGRLVSGGTRFRGTAARSLLRMIDETFCVFAAGYSTVI
jgi:hypothetical protein